MNIYQKVIEARNAQQNDIQLEQLVRQIVRDEMSNLTMNIQTTIDGNPVNAENLKKAVIDRLAESLK